MDVYQAIEKRRTVRVFTGNVPEELLRKIILAGTKAPSAGNSQPWEFIIIDDPGITVRIAELKYQQNRKIAPQRHGAANMEEVEERALRQKRAYQNCSVVAVCHKKGQAESAWMCIENMALAATAEGLGIVPSTFWGKHMEEVEKLLDIPGGYRLATVMLIGVQEGFPNVKYAEISRRPDFSWLHRNRFGAPA